MADSFPSGCVNSVQLKICVRAALVVSCLWHVQARHWSRQHDLIFGLIDAHRYSLSFASILYPPLLGSCSPNFLRVRLWQVSDAKQLKIQILNSSSLAVWASKDYLQ
jgi:hypothetical protein